MLVGVCRVCICRLRPVSADSERPVLVCRSVGYFHKSADSNPARCLSADCVSDLRWNLFLQIRPGCDATAVAEEEEEAEAAAAEEEGEAEAAEEEPTS